MLHDRRGVALIFDALAFLTIITVVCVATMQLVRIDGTGDETDRFVEEVHRSVLASTASFGDDPTPLSLMDALRSSLRSDNSSLMQEVMGQIEVLLSRYLEPEHRFLWTIEHVGKVTSVGWQDISSVKASIYVSKIQAQAAGTEVVLTLTVSH